LALSLAQKGLFGDLIGTSALKVYEAPAGKTVRIDAASVCNHSAASATITIWRPQSADAADASDANLIVEALIVPAATTKTIEGLLRQVVEPGWCIVVQADTADVLTLTMSGPEFTES
jgi:hypothetical protein